jgi:hypothetical protein
LHTWQPSLDKVDTLDMLALGPAYQVHVAHNKRNLSSFHQQGRTACTSPKSPATPPCLCPRWPRGPAPSGRRWSLSIACPPQPVSAAMRSRPRRHGPASLEPSPSRAPAEVGLGDQSSTPLLPWWNRVPGLHSRQHGQATEGMRGPQFLTVKGLLPMTHRSSVTAT